MSVPTKPDNLPRDLDETVRWAKYLDGLEPGKRNTFFAEHNIVQRPPSNPSSEPDTLWLTFLRNLFALSGDEDTVRADRLIKFLMRKGHTRDRALDRLKPFVELRSVQESWADWQTVEARRELRLRLILLETADRIDPSLCPFLEFFFKASDPSLYQTACLAVGKHLPAHGELESLLSEYAHTRGINLGEPIVLNGRRSRRRVLLVLASLVQNHSRDVPHVPSPQPLNLPADEVDPGTYLPENQADLGIVMKYFAVMNQSPHTRDLVKNHSTSVLESVTGFYRRDPSHDLLKQWNEHFLSEITTTDDPDRLTELKRLWHRAHDNVLDYFDVAETFEKRYRSLDCWDDLIRTSIRCPDHIAESLLEQTKRKLQGGDRFFHALRSQVWQRRENRRGLTTGEPDNSSAEYLKHVKDLCALPDQEGNQHFINPHEEKIFEALENLAPYFRDRQKWHLQHPRERVVRFFVVIDFFVRSSLSGDVAGAAFGFEVPATFRGSQPERSGGLSDTAVRLILNVLDWENPGVESFFHSDLIHEIGDLNLLLALLPSNRTGPFLSVLADAFEHQLRLELNERADFDLSRYLLLLTFRDPHPDFFRELATVCRTRDYDIDGVRIPLSELVRTLQGQIQDAGTLPQSESEGQFLQGFGTKFLAEFDENFPLATKIVEFRTTLIENVDELRDPRTLIEHFRTLISDTSPDGPENRPTITGLLSEIYHQESPILQSGYPAFRDQTFNEFSNQLESYADDLHRLSENLIPKNLLQYTRVEGRINTIVNTLDEISEKLLPPLPFVEEKLIEATLNRLKRILRQWSEQFETLGEALRNFFEGTSGTSRDYGIIFGQIRDRWPAPVAEEIKVSIFDHLRSLIAQTDQFEPTDLTTAEREFAVQTDPLDDEVTLIQSALEFCESDERVFADALSDTWRDATRNSMEGDEIASTIALLNDPQYRVLRREEENRETLEEARRWALDRYRIGLSHKITGQLDGDRQRPAFAAELLRFVTHYSPIWLALLIGAVLMLDFGDPWTAMARQGDIRGIGLTFGVGAISAFLYILADLRMKGRTPESTSGLVFWGKRLLRSAGFFTLCLLYTLAVVGGLWYLLSGTGEVLTGSEALGHIVVWTGFSLFFGVFMGLLSQSN